MVDQLWFSIRMRKTVWMAWPPPGAGGMDVAVAGGGVRVVVGVLVAAAVDTGALVGVAVGSGAPVGLAVGCGVLVAVAVGALVVADGTGVLVEIAVGGA